MDLERKEKLKRFILKLPLGAQLLQLRRKLIKLKLRRKKEHERKVECKRKQKLKRQEQKLKDDLINNKIIQHKLELKQRIILSKSKLKLEYQRKIIKKIRSKHKQKLLDKYKICNIHFYDSQCNWFLSVFLKYKHIDIKIESATAFEIGSGRYLIAPIGLSLLGFNKVITVDVVRLANSKYVQTVIKFYHKHRKFLKINKVSQLKQKITDENLENVLLQNFNIDYRAPYDAAHTDLPDNSVDYVFANAVFEHIRQELLFGIVKEAFRILREGGVFYTTIDFSDHRAHKNSKLTIYDYLQYSNAEWCVFDKDSNQKNRLRTSDHLAVFKAAGFEILEVKKQKITDEDHAAFATVKVADEFRQKYTDEELMEKGVNIVLRKPFISC